MRHIKLSNLKTSLRLGLGFGAVALMLSAAVIVGWSAIGTSQRSDRQTNINLVDNHARELVVMDALKVGLDENSVAADYLAHASATSDLASYRADAAKFETDYRSDHGTPDPYEAPRRQAEFAAFEQYTALAGKANADFAIGRDAAAQDLVAKLSIGSITTPAQQLLTYQSGQTVQANKASISSEGSSRTLVLAMGLLALVIAVVLARLTIRSIVKPVAEIKRVLELSATGDLRSLAEVHGKDELGQVSVALNNQLQARRGLISRFADVSRRLSAAAETMSSVSSQLASGAEESSAQASTVSAAAEQVSSNVGSVAAAAEELSASIAEIARSATDASRVANEGVEMAHSTTDRVTQLHESSTKVSEVVSLINSIAQQTNLLALNATIEAARAGEAGRGFAIVANEVKELAKQTATATEEIASTVEAIQGDATATTAAIAEIDEIMFKINHAQASIASAVEEQTATTAEIGRMVSEAATGSGDIARNIAGVATAAQQTTVGASNTLSTAGELSQMASDLKEVVDVYKF
jgi:methyl-accepting chemotaxis protein